MAIDPSPTADASLKHAREGRQQQRHRNAGFEQVSRMTKRPISLPNAMHRLELQGCVLELTPHVISSLEQVDKYPARPSMQCSNDSSY
jgi:hypothetical protein